jgi:hypothetical protein
MNVLNRFCTTVMYMDYSLIESKEISTGRMKQVGILDNYINESASTKSQHGSYPSQLPSHHHIITKEWKKIKMINLNHMISILNFVFIILFYMMR